MKLVCRVAQRILEGEFVAARSRLGGVWARRHISSCDACASAYDLLCEIGRVGLGERALPDRAVDRLQQGILRGLNRPGRRGIEPRLLVAVGTAAAVVVLAVGTLNALRPDDGYQPRRSVGSARSVRLFCLDADGVVSASATAGQRLSCPLSGFVQASYTSVEGGHLALVGRDAGGKLHWYHGPRTGSLTTVLDPSATEVILPGSVRLKAQHQPGDVEVRALFLDGPVTSAADLEKLWLERSDVDLPPVVLSVSGN